MSVRVGTSVGVSVRLSVMARGEGEGEAGVRVNTSGPQIPHDSPRR